MFRTAGSFVTAYIQIGLKSNPTILDEPMALYLDNVFLIPLEAGVFTPVFLYNFNSARNGSFCSNGF